MNVQNELPYSKRALESLAEVLEAHGALTWVDPATNNLAVKPRPRGLKQRREQ